MTPIFGSLPLTFAPNYLPSPLPYLINIWSLISIKSWYPHSRLQRLLPAFTGLVPYFLVSCPVRRPLALSALSTLASYWSLEHQAHPHCGALQALCPLLGVTFPSYLGACSLTSSFCWNVTLSERLSLTTLWKIESPAGHSLLTLLYFSL
jgi:hypothetical protein